MKYIYLSIIVLFLCHTAHAASVEDKSLKALPPEIRKVVGASGISYDIAGCKFVGRPITLSGDKPRSAYFVTVESKCLGSYAGRISIVDISGSEPSVIMKGVAYSVQSGKERHNGLNDLKIFIGDAGHANIEYWIFDGRWFIRDEKRSWYFSSDCSQQSENPENPFNCKRKNRDTIQLKQTGTRHD